MSEQFERTLLARAAGVPDAVTVAPQSVWRDVARRRRARRARAAVGACALLATVVGAGVVTWPIDRSGVVSAVSATRQPVVPAGTEAATDASATAAGRTTPTTSVYAASLSAALTGSWSDSARLSAVAAQVECADPAAQGTLATRVLVASLAGRLQDELGVDAGELTACYDPLMLQVRTADPLPPSASSLVAGAALLGVTVVWVGPGR